MVYNGKPENPIKMDDLGGFTPIFGNTHINHESDIASIQFKIFQVGMEHFIPIFFSCCRCLNPNPWCWRVVQTWLVFFHGFCTWNFECLMFGAKNIPKVLVLCSCTTLVFQCENWKRMWKDILRYACKRLGLFIASGRICPRTQCRRHQEVWYSGNGVCLSLYFTEVFMMWRENILMKYSSLVSIDGWSILESLVLRMILNWCQGWCESVKSGSGLI